MARRRTAGAIDLALYLDSLLRLAGAIALDTFAFVVWNVGTRPPLAVLRDLRRALGDARKLAIGTLAALVGFIFVVAASVLVAPVVADPAHDLTLVELFTFLVALALEYLVGDTLRTIARIRAS